MPTTFYEIRDTAGRLVAIHERRDESGGKTMQWRKPDGTLGLNGTPTTDLPLYGAEKLAGWLELTPRVVVVEGEKAAGALTARSIPAVGTVCGAAVTPAATTLAALSGRAVVLWPDNDAPGEKHMAGIATALAGVAASVWRATWPDAPPKGDAADYCDTDGDPFDVIDAAEIVKPPSPFIVPMTAFLAEEDVPSLDVVPGIVPADGLLLWVGRKESFKSMTAQTLHGACATGATWMDLDVLPMRSVYVSNEKRRRSVRERFRSIIGDAQIVHEIGIVHRAGLVLDASTDRWKRLVDEVDAMNERVLVTLDTLASLSPPGFKENSPEGMSTVLSAVRMLLNLPTPATVNLLHHPAWADQAGKEMRGRGHSSLEGEHDGLLSFDRPDRERDEAVIHVRPKDGDYQLILIAWDRDTMRIVRRDGVGMPLTIDTAVAIVGGMDGAVTVERVRQALGSDPDTGKPRYSDDRVRTVLNDAVTAGRLTATGGRGGTPRAYMVTEETP